MTDVVVVGIGADGWAGLGEPAREAVMKAEVVAGSPRQLALLPEVPGEPRPWPSPLLPALRELLGSGRRVCVLASGDPMHHGIGATIARLGVPGVRVIPHPSSVSLACARLGWPVESVTVVSMVGRPLAAVFAPGRRFIVLSEGSGSPAAVARALESGGYAQSSITVLERLGGPGERVGPLRDDVDPLNVVAVECRSADPLPIVPGLPDDAYDHDGQLTKREVRAVVLAFLRPNGLLWDVGGGAGSIAIEWMRADRACRAVSVERDPARAARIAGNAARLGVPGLRVVTGTAPRALAGLDPPDAVFVGGGLTTEGVPETCWRALGPGGRLVATAVTVESEAVLAAWHRAHGGDLTRLSVSRAAPVGGFTGWRPAMPVTIWSARKDPT
ncbi:bifunctional cobalt-precorrin-7 (C(5))-methyltransferase/cobalt-precorrin-6B (C(15))-methyltransferase [Herbidospora yilanensis]|uniref:bifunctional cobalt-precorrin-7 (C(5))-methyltransferase/cobalt-precorrin-6B (C(15))-methyltransferase n=1 Tax=Herbidospora yilanensis TaxID=354426 RepID=UPI000782C25A|nr:bifunctional cobalt-precorrin-7 (C(5))-methyltransferase/cobalt-precorrin-6B (C(15))-methyltransferase [Herbidospora yilanensis]